MNVFCALSWLAFDSYDVSFGVCFGSSVATFGVCFGSSVATFGYHCGVFLGQILWLLWFKSGMILSI